MDYKVVWSEFAENQVDEIFEFYKQRSQSYNVALKIITEIVLAPDKLIKNPRIGPKQQSLRHRKLSITILLNQIINLFTLLTIKTGS